MVVKPGRIFLRHLFTLLSRGQFFVHLDSVARADLAWWGCFLQAWHGTSLIVKDDWPSVSVYTDASGTFGCGDVCSNGRWFQIEWPPDWAHIDISVKEMVPIVCAAAIWGQYWIRHRITFYSDNAAVVAVLQQRSARDQQLLQLLRCFYFYAAHYQFTYSACHVPGVVKVAADALSRNLMLSFFSLVPQGTHFLVPHSVLTFLIHQRPAQLGLSGLDSSVQGFFMKSVSPRTLQSYRSGHRSYISFCSSNTISPMFPLSELSVTRFATSLSESSHSYGTIRVYLSGL